jgi:hypothetical protein
MLVAHGEEGKSEKLCNFVVEKKKVYILAK